MSEKLIITVGDKKQSSIMEELQSLSKLQTKELSISDIKKNVTKKKKTNGEKKKKKKGISSQLFEGTFITDSEDILENIEDDGNEVMDEFMSLVDLYEEAEASIEEGIIDEQKQSYEKLKKQDNPYKKEFAEELTILYNLLDEYNKFSKKIEKDFDAINGSKTRGMSKYTNDLLASVLNAKNGKLAVIKEIASLKKTIADLKIKEDSKKDKAENSQQQGTEFLAASYFKNIMNYGRKNFISDITNRNLNDSDEYDKNVFGAYNTDDEDFDSLLEERLGSEENPFRTNDGSKFIEYENRGVKIFVKRCIDTGDWEFIALDRDQQQILDYPVPDRKKVGKVKFSEDGSYATDERGRSYKVIEYYSPDEEYYD